jgi:orotidine-5'-phosphate decarboxylase
MEKVWNKLIVALDLTSERKTKEVINVLEGKVKKYKVGLIAYTKFGPKIVKWIKEKKADVFLDFKLFDIPNTMIEVAKNFLDLDIWAFTVHIKAGKMSLRLLKEEILKEVKKRKKKPPLIFGVTELTSQKTTLKKILNLAKVAYQANLDGVVCSVWEAKKIKEEFGLLTITPGIRKRKTEDDQKRVATVKDALRNKVDYFVVGRPIIKEKDYLKAAKEILDIK